MFEKTCPQFGLPSPEREYRFHAERLWRFDFAFMEAKVALEVEGGVWVKGRHTRGSGFIKDMEKYNTATSLGWRILRVTPDNLMKLETFNLIKTTIENGKKEK